MYQHSDGFLVSATAEQVLANLIERVKPGCDPAEFIGIVSQTFKRAQLALPGSDMSLLYRRSRSDAVLRTALSLIQSRLASTQPRILVVGCGSTYAGIDSSYADSVAREVFRPKLPGSIERIDINPAHLKQRLEPVYDVVVANSVAHFVPNLGSFFGLIRGALAGRGYFLLAREPNRRFYANQECQKSIRDIEKSRGHIKTARDAISPGKWVARLRSSLRGERSVPLHDAVNRILETDFGFRHGLTNTEIARLVDPHLPCNFPGTFSIGYEAFDWVEIGDRYLPGFRLESITTWEHLGRAHETTLLHLDIDQKLARKYPQDGCFFTAVWEQT